MSASSYSGAGQNTYESYDQHHEYQYDNGLVVWPVAGREPDFRIIRLHGGVGIRKVNFDTTRRGKPPVVPAMADTQWDTFIGGTITAGVVSPNFQVAGYNWHVHGTYLYVQTLPRVVGEDTIPTGGFPFAVAVTDAQGRALSQQYLPVYLNTVTNDPTANPFQATMEQIGTDTVDHDSERYVWPFTAMPTVFTSDTLIGN